MSNLIEIIEDRYRDAILDLSLSISQYQNHIYLIDIISILIIFVNMIIIFIEISIFLYLDAIYFY